MTQAVDSALERILLTEPSSGTKAMPSDIVGCAAEYVPGQGWIGNLGVLDSKAVLDSFPTNALVPGKVWAIVASASSFAKYNYMSSGWVVESSVGPSGSSNLPGSPSNPFQDAAALVAAYPSGGRYIGERVAMVNPAIVPRGWGWLEWSGSIWFVPAGEPISAQYTTTKNAVAIAILGQSNESGSLKVWVPGNPGSTATAINYAYGDFRDPLPGIFHSDRGSWWPRVFDYISRERKVVAGVFARGSASLRYDIVGITRPWSANTKFPMARPASGWLDRGDKGAFVVGNGNLFRCKVGNFRYCYVNAPIQATLNASPAVGGGVNDTVITVGSLQSGSSAPNWAAATVVGDTVADGGLTWELVEVGTTAVTNSAWTYSYGSPTRGWDPLGMLAAIDDWFLAQQGVAKNIVFFSQGQVDWPVDLASAPTTQSRYYDALAWLRRWANYLGYTFFVGVTCDNPSVASFSNGARPVDYLRNAVNQLITDNPSVVSSGLLRLGGDLAAALGPTPPAYPDTAGSTTPGAHLRSEAMIPASDEWIRAWDAANVS